ncbi:MAG: phosphopantothenoylcysteine decarboxylase [Patescibacteria group bacterium]
MKKKLKILVTAGSTMVMIDQVRAISNIFKGRTGAEIALSLAKDIFSQVTLIASNERSLLENFDEVDHLMVSGRLKLIAYRTYDELLQIMEQEIKTGSYDVVIHSAAVSDYQVSEVCIMEDEKLVAIDRSKKVSSDNQDLYLRLVQTQKIIDLIREPWGFKGYLVKFKLQVGISDEELIKIALKSRQTSSANMIVGNCLEWAKERAYVITDSSSENVKRSQLPAMIHKKVMEELS